VPVDASVSAEPRATRAMKAAPVPGRERGAAAAAAARTDLRPGPGASARGPGILRRVSLATALALLALPSALPAQAVSAEDLALADLVEDLTRRDTDGLAVRKVGDGIFEMPLEGRFQQVTMAQVGADGEPMLACAGSLDEAQSFLGRDLRTGKALPRERVGPRPDDLATRAARHGLTAMQMRRYETMIAKAAALPPPKSAILTITPGDGPGEGFNDPTPATPVGGNPGMTLGQQRAQLFNVAAALWGAEIDSTVPTRIAAQFNPLACAPGGATAASAGPGSAILITGGGIGGPGGTIFPVALANKLTNDDQNGAAAEITATVNSAIDSGCLGAGARFYYGFDGATPVGQFNLLVVLLHELGHGLGFLSLVNGTTGNYPFPTNDVFARFQFDRSTGRNWAQMSAAERVVSATNANNVLWTGSNVRIASGFLTAARDVDGRVEMFTPNPFNVGSSISHWNSTASPNLLMEPTLSADLPIGFDLTTHLLRDLGWFRDANNDGVADTITNVSVGATSLTAGQATTISWTNPAGFTRPVTLELSTDNGATWPTRIASGVANTGSRSWTVPNIPTTQARVRVREHDFAAPVGSSANFTIVANQAPVLTPVAPLTRQQGSPGGAAVTLATTSDAETAASALVVTRGTDGATGITLSPSPLGNSNGTISGTVAASCTAASGSVRLLSSDGVSSTPADLQVNVTANAPPTLSYGSVTGNLGGSLVHNPSSGPADNGSIASIVVQSQGTFTGTATANPTTGALSLSNLGPGGTHFLTIRATDNCGATRDTPVLVTVVANTPPVFSTPAIIARQQGSPAQGATLGTVSDAQTPAGSLTLSQVAGGTATGVTVAGFNITGFNTVTATVAASCTATTGTVRLRASDGALATTSDLQVDVAANAAPSLAYAAAAGAAGGSLVVSPATAPSDNGSVASIVVQSLGTFSGTATVNASTGAVSLSNLGPIGTHTITVRATDNCGAVRDATIALTVGAANTPPSITFGINPLGRQQGSPGGFSGGIITVNDAQTPANQLTVTQIGGGTATGVTASVNLIESSGMAFTRVLASCTATSGTVRMQVSDGSLTATGDLSIDVSANTPPILTYAATTGTPGGNLVVNPTTGPVDNGNIAGIVVQSPGTFTGTATVNATTGALSLSNLGPVGTHTITVRATDNCGAVSDATLQIAIGTGGNTAPVFTPSTAVTPQAGSPASSFVLGTVTDAQTPASGLTVTLTRDASLANPTQITIGADGTVRASLQAGCIGGTNSGTLTLRFSDGGFDTIGVVPVNILANTPPSLAYPPSNPLTLGTSRVLMPLAPPSDNGAVAGIVVTAVNLYTGGITIDQVTGALTLTNIGPIGTHTPFLRATDNCGAQSFIPVQLDVTADAIFGDGFEASTEAGR
jgi:hypothetical protein